MPSMRTMLAVVATTVAAATLGIAAPAAASGAPCTVTMFQPYKSGNNVIAQAYVDCAQPPVNGDGFFIRLWRHDGGSTYTKVKTIEDSRGIFPYTATLSYACTGTSAHVFHAEAFGWWQVDGQANQPFSGDNSPNSASLACK